MPSFDPESISSLSQADRLLFTQFGFGPHSKAPFECIHHAFEHYAESYPENVAVEDFEWKITYGDLNHQSDLLSNGLHSAGVAPGARICLLVERSIPMVLGMIAILKAGMAYVPLDGNVVTDKVLEHALKDSGSSLILVQRKFAHRVQGISQICIEDALITESSDIALPAKPPVLVTSHDSACIIYTNNTTGDTKGVDVMHRNVVNLVCTPPGDLSMGPGVRVAQLMNISSDMATWEILGSMCNGATLCLRGKTSKEWRTMMKTVDVVIATPSILAVHHPVDYPNIKVVAVAGEPCPKALADVWAKAVALYYCCGSPEVTTVITMDLYQPGGSLEISRPIFNSTVYILDESKQPVGIGEVGVMWVGGAGVTRGYLNSPEKTSEKYVPDPFLNDESVMFNTENLGRWTALGNLEYLGKIDCQEAKGFRVELDCGSIESPKIVHDNYDQRALEQQREAMDEVSSNVSQISTLLLSDGPFDLEPLRHLSPEDQERFNAFSRGPTIEPPFNCVHHAFEHQARMHPDAIAVEDFSHKISFAELERQANCLAGRLRARGVAPKTRVCLLVERSILMVVGILAILKAGAAYVPLDGNVVANKTLEHALKDSGSSLVLVQRKFTRRVQNMPLICLEDSICDSPFPSTHCVKPEDVATPDDSAYIIYTSGTTGVPKGVDVKHRNITNLVCLTPGNLKMQSGTRVSQLMNISFDMAAWEILGSMCNGATLCLRGKTSKEWRAVMKTVDIVIATPSMLALHEPAEYPNVKVVAVAGEPCPKILADKWAETTTFYNCCGPTEITIVNTMHLHSPGISLSIGAPNPNTSVYILDENMKPCKIGDMGVMWAGGAGITRGYLNLPEKTTEQYQHDPFLNDGSLMFNTGDLGRWLPNGDLEHLGRVDHQVKVKGFRVELDGVATAMEETPGVKVAAAVLMDGELWGFYSPSSVTPEAVREATARVQPHYAVPTKFVNIDSFPETQNGKVDKEALGTLIKQSFQIASVPFSQKSASGTPSEVPEKNVEKQAGLPNQSMLTLVSTQSSSISNPPALVGIPLEKDIGPSKLEDQTSIWAGYEEDILPEKDQPQWFRNFRHLRFYLYRRLFSFVFVINLCVLISFAAKGYTTKEISNAVIGNLTLAILMRQEYVIDAFFIVFTAVPRSWPMWIRRVCARVYHIGGIHSGAGVSGTMWLIYFCAKATQEFSRGQGVSGATLFFSYATLVLLCTILVFVYPTNRKKFHNTFEVTHRFLGWAAVALVWGQVILFANDHRGIRSLGDALVHTAAFWLTWVKTISLVLPWLRLAKVPVQCEKLSNHAVRMYFDYTTPGAGSFVRLSDSPLNEWHSFATIPEPGKQGFSLVVSRAGDWTIRMISKPPTHIWKRGIPTYGVMRIAKMFNRIVLVATGSGIGPCTPAILGRGSPIRLLWTAPNVRETFGDKLVNQILEANPEAVIYNTREHGKPDMVKLTFRLVKEFNAEAVIIISNQPLTEKVVYGMVSRGIPAFGAIWDS